MRNTRWIYKENKKNYNIKKYSKDMLSILENRGLTKENEIEKFIECNISDLRNPFDLKDMEKAVDFILEKKQKKETICIYGDYDVDGITSTSLLYLGFKEIGIDVEYYIPLRDEGYGLNKHAIKEIKETGASLIITVDCGISSLEEVEYANELRMDMIITDHHEINNELPNAYCVINCKREDNKYDFKSLAGVGTAFMLLLALYRKLHIEDSVYKYLDIVAIGTVADIVPLVEDNRIIVKKGLEQLSKTKWNGVKFLLRKLFPDFSEREYDTYDVGFIIAPVFNAAGRLEDAKMGVELFTSENNKVCDELSYTLIEKNLERKNIQSDIYDLTVDEIERKKLYEKNIIVVAKENFHHGVIGIVASKIIDRYYKPAVIMEIKKDEGIATASCRSIDGFNMIEALNSMRELFVKYGGHAGAAGFSIPIENIEIFTERMDKYIEEKLEKSYFLKPIKIDKEVQLQKISYDFLDEISKLRPFGFGNSIPVFSMKNCSHSNLRKIGKDQSHLMMNIIKNGVEIKNCAWFGAEDMFQDIDENPLLDIAFKLKLERFRNKYQYKIYIEDIKKSDNLKVKNGLEEDIEIYDTKFPIETVFYTKRKTSENLKLIYSEGLVFITDRKVTVGELDAPISYLLTSLHKNYNYNFKVEISKIVVTEENYNIHIKIDRDYSFECFKIKSNEIFNEIKNFLIGKMPYNLFQKRVLAEIFKNKKAVTAIYEENRGVGVISKTIALYYKVIGKKVLFVGKNIPDEIKNFGEISEKIKDNYDFYIFYNENLKNYPENSLVFLNEEPVDTKREIVRDSYEIPHNVIITEEENLFDKKYIWSKKLPFAKKYEIIKNLNQYEKIYATDEIKEIL
ncbi:single-stranded-DNA-specific exonuclease RecJ [Fusobacterium sp.]|uniref:single-stranded-DNA-specific exonuclease RecJ n=1 Tax=Fusobacterium sp. TaxID=68766 RepID=UPI00260F2A93|nr:single-stranded-DNA-specific exonuclease RecJ [Fusobacterium sp.]